MLEATKYIKRLANTDSSNEKKAIIREAAVEGCVEFFEGFQLAYNKIRIFGIKKVPVIEGDFTEAELQESSETFNWNEFLAMIHKLESKEIEGETANQVFHLAANVVCIDDWNHFYRPILLKDMKCGVRETTVNKVLQEMGGDACQYLTPIWAIQTADIAKDISGKKAIDPLLSGTRLITVLDINVKTIRMFTKKGKETNNFANIIKGLEELLPSIPVSLVLDGMIVNQNFQGQKADCYALFDLLPLEDFEAGICPMTQMDRHDGLVELQGFFQEHTDGSVYVLPKLMVDFDIEADREKMKDFGPCVIKDPEAPYIGGATQNWLKMIGEDNVIKTM